MPTTYTASVLFVVHPDETVEEVVDALQKYGPCEVHDVSFLAETA